MQCTTIAVDVSKSVFQLSLADSKHCIVDRQRLSRARFSRFLATAEPARLVMEACATAHNWARVAQQYGHRVKRLHAHFVRPYLRRDKTDAADALLQADQDRELKPVPVKNEHQQALQRLHRIRAQWHETRTARIHCAKALLAEFEALLPRGGKNLALRLRQASDDLPHPLQQTLHRVIDEIVKLGNQLNDLDRELSSLLENEPDAARLRSISGITRGRPNTSP